MMANRVGEGNQTGLAAWLLAWARTPLWNRFASIGKVRAERRMELVETLQLGGKRQLMLVVCDGRRYLVGAGGDSVHSIAEMRQIRQTSDRKQPPAASFRPLPAGEGLRGEARTPAIEPSDWRMKCSF